MIDAFGVSRPDLVSKQDPRSAERARHYGTMAGTMGALGGAAGTVGAGSGIIGHLESKGHDPMGFTEREKPGQKALSGAARMRVLKPVTQAHRWQAKTLGGLAAGSLGLAGAYKYKQHLERQKMASASPSLAKALTVNRTPLTPQTRQKLDRASDVGLGAGSAAVGGIAMKEGMAHARFLNRQANEHGRAARFAHHLLSGEKMSEGGWATPQADIDFARRGRKVGARVMAVKKPAAALAAGAAAAGGAGLFELGRHAVASSKTPKPPSPKPVTAAKRDVGEKERKSLAAKGKALPGGGFPIKNKGDLANAKQAIGRAKNPKAARALINRRAEELGEPGIGKAWANPSFTAGAAQSSANRHVHPILGGAIGGAATGSLAGTVAGLADPAHKMAVTHGVNAARAAEPGSRLGAGLKAFGTAAKESTPAKIGLAGAAVGAGIGAAVAHHKIKQMQAGKQPATIKPIGVAMANASKQNRSLTGPLGKSMMVPDVWNRHSGLISEITVDGRSGYQPHFDPEVK